VSRHENTRVLDPPYDDFGTLIAGAFAGGTHFREHGDTACPSSALVFQTALAALVSSPESGSAHHPDVVPPRSRPEPEESRP
jgi:hypothetical protein